MRLPTFIFVICLSSSVLADDYSFGRIFTDADERERIDELRQNETDGLDPEFTLPLPITLPEKEEDPQKRITYSGAIVKDGDQSTVWIDGKSDVSGHNLPPHQMTNDETASAKIRTSRSERSLKPGQTWLVEQDQVIEAWQSAPVTNGQKKNGNGES